MATAKPSKTSKEVAEEMSKMTLEERIDERIQQERSARSLVKLKANILYDLYTRDDEPSRELVKKRRNLAQRIMDKIILGSYPE